MRNPLQERRKFRKIFDVKELLRLRRSGVSIKDLAQHFGVTVPTIRSRLEWHAERALEDMQAAPERPAPSLGLTHDSKTYFAGQVAALRFAGLYDAANEIEQDMARLEALALKFGFVAHAGDLAEPPAILSEH